jgi:hypothetical protein
MPGRMYRSQMNRPRQQHLADDRVPPSAQIEQLQQAERSTAVQNKKCAKMKRRREVAPPLVAVQKGQAKKRRRGTGRRQKETDEEIDRREEEEAAEQEEMDEYQFDEYLQEGYEAGAELTQQ